MVTPESLRVPLPPEIEAAGHAIVKAPDGHEVILLEAAGQLHAIDEVITHRYTKSTATK